MERPLCSACLIVKDEAKALRLTLPELVAGVDEVIVVDTGSQDETVTLATSVGAKVFHFPWADDFAAARNASLGYATGNWILWIDADEFVPRERLQQIRPLLEQAQGDGFWVQIFETPFGATHEIEQNEISYARIKIFRNGQGIHFRRRINEDLFYPDGTSVHAKASLPLTLAHWGGKSGLSFEAYQNKKRLRIPLYEKCLAENPEDVTLYYLLGETHRSLGEFAKADPHFERAFCYAATPAEKAQYLFRRAQCAQGLGLEEMAVSFFQQAVNLFPQHVDSLYFLGKSYLAKKSWETAKKIFQQILEISLPRASCFPVMAERYREKPHYFLGTIALAERDPERAVLHLQKALMLRDDRATRERLNRALEVLRLTQQVREIQYATV